MTKIQVEYVKPETVQTKYGEKTKYSIKDSNERWYSCWDRDMAGVKQGDTIEGEVLSREYNGKTYYDFKLPRKEDLLERRIEALEKAVFGTEETKDLEDIIPF